MNKSRFILLVTIIPLTFFLAAASCDGPEGPQGAMGEQGPQGEQGPEGPPGTANVIYSDWMNIAWNLTDNATFKQMYIEEPRVVEEDFIENGTLLMYFKLEVPEGIVTAPLPFTNGTDYLTFLAADVPGENVEGIVVRLEATDGTTDVQSDWNDYQFRYVMVPGGVPAKMGDGFLKDYSAVKEYYGLPD